MWMRWCSVLLAVLCGVHAAFGAFSTTTAAPPASLSEVEESSDRWTQSIPCRVPTFVKILPVSFRRHLRKIWSGVPANGDCGKQLLETRDLVNSLPHNLKMKIAEFGEVEDKFRANFFSELLPEEKLEFGQLLKNLTLSAEEKVEQLRDWGRERLSLAAFENFEEYLNVFLERDRKFQAKLKKLSPEARKAYERIQELRREKQQLMGRLTEKAKKELASLFRHECSAQRPRHRHMQWDPVGAVGTNPAMDPSETELACLGVRLGDNASQYVALTKSYGRERPPATTTPLPVDGDTASASGAVDSDSGGDTDVDSSGDLSETASGSTEETKEVRRKPTFSSGRHLFHLLLQRVQYLRP